MATINKAKKEMDRLDELYRKTREGKEEPERYYYAIANLAGMKNNELYAQFMLKAFNGLKHVAYAYEWAERFQSGDPCTYMDKERIKAYLECLASRYGYRLR